MIDTATDLSDDGIAAIADPVRRARVLRAIAKDKNTLTPTQSRIYQATVAELRGDGERKQTWIARRLGISRQRVSDLLRSHNARTETAA